MKKLIVILLLILSTTLYAKSGSIGKVIAYPNPFNNKTEALTIHNGDIASPGGFTGNVTMTVYTINLIQVYQKEISGGGGLPIKWSGHDKNGRRLKPGLYFIKLIERDSGTVNDKMIKIIIK